MECQHRQRRRRGLKLAALTSLVCKGGNLWLQVLAIPMALVVLGEERFGLFAAVNALVSAVLISDFGVGPGLTNLLARKLADNDEAGASASFATAFWLIAGLGGLGCLILAGVVAGLPVAKLFGERFVPFAAEMRLTAYLGLVIIFIRMLVSVVDRARAAHQETFVNNLFGAIGNVLSAIVLLVGVRHWPSPWFLMAAVHGGLAATSLANAIHFLAKRPQMWPTPRGFRRALAKFLLLDGLAFCAIMSLAPLFKSFGCYQILGRLAGPGAVAVFDVLQRMNIFVYGFVIMFTFPLWPALSDAAARGDWPWIRSVRWRMCAVAGLYVASMTAGLSSFGPTLVDLWLKGRVRLDHWTLFCFCLSFGVSIWQHVHHIFLVALDDVRWMSFVVLVEIPLYLAAAHFGYRWGALPGLFLGVAASGLIASIIFPFRASKKVLLLERGTRPSVQPNGAPALG